MTKRTLSQLHDDAKMLYRIAHDRTLAWMDDQIKSHTDVIRQMQDYKAQLKEAALVHYENRVDSERPDFTPIQIIASFTNAGQNLQRNLRPDLGINNASAMAIAGQGLFNVRAEMNRG